MLLLQPEMAPAAASDLPPPFAISVLELLPSLLVNNGGDLNSVRFIHEGELTDGLASLIAERYPLQYIPSFFISNSRLVATLLV